jgi:hypothetical protein
MFSSAAAFSHDPDLRHRVRLALERREQRQLKRRDQRGKTNRKKAQSAANRGHKPML